MNRPHIGIFGRCNAGKSSLLNFITRAQTAIVSPQSGTTTDVVRKHYEIAGFAPVVLIDTAGVDDTSALGTQRVERTLETICQIDLAILVFREWGAPEQELTQRFRAAALPYIALHNRVGGEQQHSGPQQAMSIDVLYGGDKERNEFLSLIEAMIPEKSHQTPLMFSGSVGVRDIVLLVCPIDAGAPAGRLILPQVQAIRELLDAHAIPIVVQLDEVATILATGVMPKMVVADSQALKEVEAVVGGSITTTTFSILLAAAKGDYREYVKGLEAADSLCEGDKILIAENCSHQAGCDDIGRVKIPAWL